MYLWGCVGADAFGQNAIRTLKKFSVHTDSIGIEQGMRTGTAYICVAEDGVNCIVVDAGANACVSPAYIERNASAFDGADYCVMQLEIPFGSARRTVELCRKNRTRIVLNPSPFQALPDDLLRGLDFIVPNQTEFERMAGAEMETISDDDMRCFAAAKGIGNLVITTGGDRCIWATPDSVARFPATDDKPVDTTGAGDCFLGAFVEAFQKECLRTKQSALLPVRPAFP